MSVQGEADPGQEGFETEADVSAEDRLRARRMRRVLNRPGRTTWLNMRDRLWLARQRSPRAIDPLLDRAALQVLANSLDERTTGDCPPLSLASARRMRTIRQGLGRALLDALADYADSELRTVTVIYTGWSFTPAELGRVSAARLKAQFRRHLDRAGVLRMRGPLFAVLHGEFEPTSGRFQLHYHLVTTVAKAAALKAGLTAIRIRGYAATATGAAPVRRSRVRDRLHQLTYLAKSFWPGRPVIQIDGKVKRVRRYRRIPEPYGAQVLLWLDRQTFADLVVMNHCWSRRRGGSEAMKRLCLFVAGVG